jgi:hypothetical protein
MLSVVEIVGVMVAVCLIAVGLWPGPWRLNISVEPGDEDRINAIKVAIDILQQELADLEAIEHEARMERLVPALTTP